MDNSSSEVALVLRHTKDYEGSINNRSISNENR